MKYFQCQYFDSYTYDNIDFMDNSDILKSNTVNNNANFGKIMDRIYINKDV